MDFRELLEKGPVVFDGGMGTYVSAFDSRYSSECERAVLEDAGLVFQIHREYIEAGAVAVKTDTFAANRLVYGEDDAAAIISAAFKTASEAAGESVSVFADIGQISASPEIREDEYTWMADRFLEAGAGNFLFESQADFSGIAQASEHIRIKCPEAYIIASFSFNDAGFTSEGLFAGDLLRQFRSINKERQLIDALGFNCGCSAGHMQKIVERLDFAGVTLSVMPNSGYPVVVNRRTVYEGDPVYFASRVADMAGHGAVILGGCCGTTPAHTEQICRALKDYVQKSDGNAGRNVKTEANEDQGSRFWDKLVQGRKPVAVELDPPQDADITKFMKGVRELREARADIITIADCPIGRARMDSSLLACKIHREEGVEALPHMTCRDRNLNATQALMLGLYAEGIRNMLLVTGDPVPSAERDEVKAVYQFNSRKFAAFASSLSERMFPGDVHFFGALNVNARNFDVQIRLAKEKILNGIAGFLTQPVLTPQAFENLKKAKEELDGFILGGIIPVVSERNARFMNSEISGINVDEKVIEMYAGKSREEAEDLAVSICCEIARQMEPYVDGFYFMTPFQRTSLIKRILSELNT